MSSVFVSLSAPFFLRVWHFHWGWIICRKIQNVKGVGREGVWVCSHVILKKGAVFCICTIFWQFHGWWWWRNTHDGHHHANGNQAVAFLCLREYCAVGHYGADVFPIIATIDTLLLHSHKTGNIQDCTIKKYSTNVWLECFNSIPAVCLYNISHTKVQWILA